MARDPVMKFDKLIAEKVLDAAKFVSANPYSEAIIKRSGKRVELTTKASSRFDVHDERIETELRKTPAQGN